MIAKHSTDGAGEMCEINAVKNCSLVHNPVKLFYGQSAAGLS